MTESDVNQERRLARTLSELREVFTRAKMFLPAVSFTEMLLLAGAVEQAKSEGMSARRGRPPGIASKQAVQAVPALPASPSPSGKVVKRIRLSVGMKNKVVQILPALCMLLDKQKPMTVRQIIESMDAKGWKLNTMSSDVITTVRGVLNRHTKLFKSIVEDGAVLYSLTYKQETSKRTKKLSPKKDARPLREAVTAALLAHGRPITGPDLAKKMGIDNAQRLSMLLVSLRSKGSIKKISKNGTLFWTINKEQGRTLASEPQGKLLNGAPQETNGVAHA